MIGNYFTFVKIKKENEEHQNMLKNISKETSYLGDLTAYEDNDTFQITGNNYVIYENINHNIIGYLGLSPIVDTPIGKSVTIYYAVSKKYYGQGYGKLILNDITNILKEHTPVDVLIANVDRSNTFGLKTIKKASFKAIEELSDDEEIQFHKYL